MALNAEAVTGRRGGEWTASALNGGRRAQNGLLHDELYVGTRLSNRRHFREHPEIWRRSRVLNPKAEWLKRPLPQLRILDVDLWNWSRARKVALPAGNTA